MNSKPINSTMSGGDIAYAIRELVKSMLAGEIHTCMPARVELANNSDLAFSTADVQPLLKIAQIDGTQLELPKIPDVPVLQYGNATCGVKIELNKGDMVLLIFMERSIGDFIQTGNISGTLYNQNFALGNAFAIPMFLNGIGGAVGSGDITVYNKGTGKVILGDAATAQKLITETFSTIYNAHVHVGGTGIPAVPLTGLELTLSTKAK